MQTPEEIYAQKAFVKAIKEGRLSSNPAADNYAGRYMFMCTDSSGKDLFKHELTREYID